MRKILSIVIAAALSLTMLAGCQNSTSETTTQLEANVKSEITLEDKFTAEQLETFEMIYSCEHTDKQLESIGADSVLANEQTLARAYIVQEVLPENGVDLYMAWRNEVHPE